MKNFKTENDETICLELIIAKKKWCILLFAFTLLASLWVVYCISRWGGQVFIVTLVFGNFEENINNIFWGCLLLTDEEKWRSYWGVGWANNLNVSRLV